MEEDRKQIESFSKNKIVIHIWIIYVNAFPKLVLFVKLAESTRKNLPYKKYSKDCKNKFFSSVK